tara:strand:- start:127 stop:444 length:318 start_codon:yes stop_codon:yes gene_type:complete
VDITLHVDGESYDFTDDKGTGAVNAVKMRGPEIQEDVSAVIKIRGWSDTLAGAMDATLKLRALGVTVNVELDESTLTDKWGVADVKTLRENLRYFGEAVTVSMGE